MSLILSGTDGLSDVDGSAATPAIRGTDANTGIFFGTDIIGFSEGGAECARFDSSGNFGIGGTPSKKLQVTSSDVTDGIRLYSSDTGGEGLSLEWMSAFGSNRITADIESDASGAGGNFAIRVADTSAVLQTRLLIDNGGNLGVGTTSPTSRLEVVDTASTLGQVRINGSGVGSLFAGMTAGSIGFLHSNTGTLAFGTSTSDNNLVERARINSAGMLSVNYTSAISGGLFIVSSNGVKGSLLVKNDDSVQLYSLGTGTVTCSGGVLGFTSDERIKIDDGNYSGGLNAVLNITPKYFYYKNSEGNKDETKGRELGFFAQNIQQTCGLEVVHQPEDPDALLGIHDRGVMAVLVSAIQEQQALITTLTDRITALENK